MIILNAMGFYSQQSRGAPRLFANGLTVGKATFQNYYGYMSDDTANGPFGNVTPLGQYPNGPNWGQCYAFSSGSFTSRAYGVSNTNARRFVFPDDSPITTLKIWFDGLGPGLDDDTALATMPWDNTNFYYRVINRTDIYNFLVSQRNNTFGIYIEGVD